MTPIFFQPHFCTSAPLKCSKDIKLSLDSNKLTVTIFIDLTKAFHLVIH